MAKINLLGKDISELIAAGEVIERPASVIKELVENSIDAGARHITVEIKNGGTTYMRVTDDGCGIARDQVGTAFLRHATSKIQGKEDLDSIMTLGFRGEALASVAAVAKVELLTKQHDDHMGTDYRIEGSVEVQNEPAGCPDGTTLIIRDIFYNVPVRRKFLKKDTTEGNAVTAVMQKIILSHPEIAFKLIRDNKVTISSVGDGQLLSAVYGIYGRDFAHDLIPVDYSENGIAVKGYVIKPLYSKKNRSFQNFFINGRSVRTVTGCAALEEAYKNLVMTGKYPACILMLEAPPETVDVNIHPAKAEVRFSDEKLVYSAVYFAVKNALMASGLIYEFELGESKPHDERFYKAKPFEPEKFTQISIQEQTSRDTVNASRDIDPKPEQPAEEKALPSPLPEKSGADTEEKAVQPDEVKEEGTYSDVIKPVSSSVYSLPPKEQSIAFESSRKAYAPSVMSVVIDPEEVEEEQQEKTGFEAAEEELEGFSYISRSSFEEKPQPEPDPEPEEKPEVYINVIGELFKNYILAQWDNSFVMIDKHAAHERVIFEKLKKGCKMGDGQLLLTERKLLLSESESGALKENYETLKKMGFSLDFSGLPYLKIEGIPMVLEGLEMDEVIPEIAENLSLNKNDPQTHLLDDMLHELACKASIKANDKTSVQELQALAEEVINDENIRHCPHGRPVMFTLSKREIEKQFRRIV